MSNHVTCPSCKGSKVNTMTMVSFFGKPSEDEGETTTITCVTCDGKGTVTPAVAKQLQEEMAMWCSCEEPSGEVDFYDDGQHPELHKHHYRCQKCQGVVQIG